MQILHHPSSPLRDTVLTIGSFDGVHLGHQQIIRQVRQLAQEIGGQSVLITFHPHPRTVVTPSKPDAAPLRLIQTLEEKAQCLERYGVDVLVVVPFNPEFAAQSPEGYIEHFLVERFSPRHIVIGYDHRFGKNRQGNIEYLKNLAPRYGYAVQEISPQDIDNLVISSSKIRQALTNGDIAQANKLLGHPFQLGGTVVHGQRLGRQLGFPTANLQPTEPAKLIPPVGIYAVRAWVGQTAYAGMLYIGHRPTLQDGLAKTIELNIFDFQGDLYGQYVQTEILEHLRDDIRFETLDQLRDQLHRDKAQAQAALQPYFG